MVEVFSRIKKRQFTGGENVTVSIRLPKALKAALEKLAKDSGRGFSDVVQDALDDFAVFQSAQNPPKRAR